MAKVNSTESVRFDLAKHYAQLELLKAGAGRDPNQRHQCLKVQSFLTEAERALARHDFESAKKALYKARAMGRMPDRV